MTRTAFTRSSGVTAQAAAARGSAQKTSPELAHAVPRF